MRPGIRAVRYVGLAHRALNSLLSSFLIRSAFKITDVVCIAPDLLVRFTTSIVCGTIQSALHEGQSRCMSKNSRVESGYVLGSGVYCCLDQTV